MVITLEIPDETACPIGLSQAEILLELKKDLAIGMYVRGVLSAGRSALVAGITRMDFERLLYEHHIVRNYSMEDLEHDLAWAKAEQDRS